MNPAWNDIVDRFRRQTRRIVGVRGVAWVGIVLVGLLWTVGLIDWSLHVNSSWVRLAMGVGVAVAVAATIWRTLVRPLTVRLSDVDIARTIERRDPQWAERLSSAAQFRTDERAQRLGSPELQRTVMTDVDARLSGINVRRVFATTSTKRLVWLSAVVCVAGVAGAFWQHQAAATGLSRIAMPFAEIPWPRTTELQFLDADLQVLKAGPLRTTAGEPLPLYVENHLGPLPENSTLQLRFADGRVEDRTLQSTVLRDDSGSPHEVAIATFTAHQGPIRYRAVGGDDADMPWRTLEVMPAPALVDVTVTITPPAYARQEPRTLNGAGAVEALIGSQVRFAGRANKPLAQAWLRREGQPPQEMPLTNNLQEFTVAFTVNEPGHTWFWFNLTDEFGLESSNPPRYELRGIVDRPPTVFLDQPAEDMTVTPDADVLLRIVARDDLGIASLSVVHSQSNATPARRPLNLSADGPTEEIVEMVWSLASLGLAAGDRITYHIEAVDAFDLPESSVTAERRAPSERDEPIMMKARSPGTGGQVGISAYRHIDILSTEEKQRELATRQLRLLDSLHELEERQSRVLETTAGLRIQTELAESLQEDDLDLLKQTELQQQGIREQLIDAQSGALVEAEAIQQELERNRIDDSKLSDRLGRLAFDLKSLTQEVLPAIEQSLARARKLSQSSTGDRQPTRSTNISRITDPAQQLQRAERNQSRAVAVMKSATEELGRWRRQYEVLSELDDLIVDQTEIQHQTQDVGRETLTKRSKDLTPQQQADLARLSDRQRRLADRLDELISQGTEPLSEGEAPSPSIEAMQQALRQLAERKTAGQMHNAAESLRRNDIARTAETQQQILSDMRDFGDLLHSADGSAAETLLSTLEEQVEEVETLRKRQDLLTRDARQAMSPSADPDQDQQLQQLIKEQETLAQRAEDLAGQLRRQQSRRSSQSAGRAARRMREAQQAIAQRQPEQTATSQQDALDDLQQLSAELARQQRDIEQKLALQQIEQLTGDLQSVADRQQALVDATLVLDEQRQERGSWSRSLRKELRESTDEQTALAERIDELRSSLSEYPVIDLLLEKAVDPMKAAVERMERSDVGEETVQQQRTAHQRLQAMIDVTQESDEAGSSPAANNSGPQPNRTSPDTAGAQSPQLLGTQLRLLRHLQSDVRTRTIELVEGESPRSALDDEAIVAERKALALDQDRIAELTRILLEQFTEMPEQHP